MAEQSNLCAMMRDGSDPVIAPLVLNPLMAKLAEQVGFRALYVGGVSLGYLTCFTEANLTGTEMAQAALDIQAACALPLMARSESSANRCLA